MQGGSDAEPGRRSSAALRGPREVAWVVLSVVFAVGIGLSAVVDPRWGPVLAVPLLLAAGVAEVRAERARRYLEPGVAALAYLPELVWRAAGVVLFLVGLVVATA